MSIDTKKAAKIIIQMATDKIYTRHHTGMA